MERKYEYRRYEDQLKFGRDEPGMKITLRRQNKRIKLEFTEGSNGKSIHGLKGR